MTPDVGIEGEVPDGQLSGLGHWVDGGPHTEKAKKRTGFEETIFTLDIVAL